MCGFVACGKATEQSSPSSAKPANQSRIALTNTTCGADCVKDTSSGLIWGPTSSNKMNQNDAITYCSNLNLDNKKWTLPSGDQYLKAFNPSNQERYENDLITKSLTFPTVVVNQPSECYWSSSVEAGNTDPSTGGGSALYVRCVSNSNVSTCYAGITRMVLQTNECSVRCITQQ